MMQENNSTHWIMGGALLLIGLFVIIALVMTRSQAVDTSVEITNVAPVVSLVKACEETAGNTTAGCSHSATVTPVADPGTRNVDVYAQIVDDNGTQDIDLNLTKATLFRSGLAGGYADCDTGGEADGNFCRPQFSCVTDSTTNSTTIVVKCDNVTMLSWADPTVAAADDFSAQNWVVRVDTKDLGQGNLSHFATNTFEVAEVIAVTVPGVINYGSGGSARALGYTSDTAGTVDVVMNNLGNVDVDAQIKADQASMTCTIGTIAAANQKFKVHADAAYASLTNTLTTSFADMDLEDIDGANNAIQRRNNESTAPGANVHFGIQIPTTGVGGNCTGTSTISSIKQSLAGGGQ